MRVERFKWNVRDPRIAALEVRLWAGKAEPRVDLDPIEKGFFHADSRDQFLLDLTARFDATDVQPTSLEVTERERSAALSNVDNDLLKSLEVAATNIRTVAEAQMDTTTRVVDLPQGQSVAIREVPIGAAGIYAPGGRAAYPSSVLMCVIPAQVAGVGRIALATPPGPDGRVNAAVLAAASLCGVDEVYSVGGAQAILALAHGTETIERVNVVAGPGNAWVREAKMSVSGFVAIDSLAGPSELMIVLDGESDLRWAALDLCAQAEHGSETPLLAVAVDEAVLEELARETQRAAASRSGVADAPLALVQVPDMDAAISLANAFAPEHLQLLVDDAEQLASGVRTAGCIFVGSYSATAFGDYAAGSNHVLPTAEAGRFSGPLGPSIFRRKIATVEVPPDAAAKLAPHVDTIARAEGFPVHGESAMIRAQ
ncbi:MAG TPA: histidinol dehydrogenase [Solirubrobacterales bacterium]